jgi:hypothetical protein
MQYIYVEAAIIAIILAFPLFFTSRHLGRTLGFFAVVAGVSVLLMTLPGTSSMLQNAYAAAYRAVD